jgi:hypothetical protein
MKKYNAAANVVTARNAAIATGGAHGKALILWALTMGSESYTKDQVDAEFAAYEAAGVRLSYGPALRRIASGKADGSRDAVNPHDYAYATANKAAAKRKGGAKAKAKATKAAKAPEGNPLKGVSPAQVLSWLAEAGTAKAVYKLLDGMVK